jgi:hypothetical protein
MEGTMTNSNGSVSCDDCRAAEDASVHVHQNFRGRGVDLCQSCPRMRLEQLLMTGPDRTFFRRLDAWVDGIAAKSQTPA